MSEAPYVDDRFLPRRRVSRAVMVGPVQVGGDAPLVVQSMCTTPTQDVEATLAQCIRLAEVGCQAIRITAPGVKDARALADIRQRFSAAGFAAVPLVADIHFMPAAAMEAVEHVEKVRINPGNFADKKRFEQRAYTDAEYDAELQRIHERFSPLVLRARELGRALRIGTNHGSLSDRIMNRYGDTPAGMVASAMEFVHIAEDHDFRDLIISMKSSNPKVMVQAYRLLVAELRQHGCAYPLHLGVTEAGDGEDGRIKGAAGIGALLEDGIGDTIRVSLTEAPEAEIPVARALAERYRRLPAIGSLATRPREAVDPYRYQRRAAEIVRIGADVPVGGTLVPRVLIPAGSPDGEPAADARIADAHLWALTPVTRPGFEAGLPERPAHRSQSASQEVALRHHRAGDALPADCRDELILLDCSLLADPAAAIAASLEPLQHGALIGIAEAAPIGGTATYRLLAACIEEGFRQAEHEEVGSGIRHAICIALPHEADELAIGAIAGGLLIDGIGDALYLPRARDPRGLAYTVLQATKARVTRTEYVACPSCGRTLFDLMEVTEHIKAATNHLDNVTIAIMGCIVNGPGEMADADFGFVGSGPGKIDLYRGRERVRRNIPFAEARDELIALIKEYDMWHEAPAAPAR